MESWLNDARLINIVVKLEEDDRAEWVSVSHDLIWETSSSIFAGEDIESVFEPFLV